MTATTHATSTTWRTSFLQRVAFAATGLLVATRSVDAAKAIEIDSEHYRIWSSAPKARTADALHTAEILHRRWTRWTNGPLDTTKHRLRLFASRHEMRQALPGLGWAEAIYHDGICDQYDDVSAERPWQWLIHEATHQLAWEDAHLELPRWANEGLACLFGVSRIRHDRLILGSVEPETYPTWWLAKKPLSRDLARDLKAGLLVAPSQILNEPDGIGIASTLNAHYLSWWSMAHFFNATDSVAWRDWVLHDATKPGLLRRFGPEATLDKRWYAHVLNLQDSANKH